jgi:hypothetical protein
MPFSLNDNYISFSYASGDLKGGSESNPVTMEDYYNADVANGWGHITKTGNHYLVNGRGLHCSNGWLRFENVTVFVVNNPASAFFFFCYFTFINCVFKENAMVSGTYMFFRGKSGTLNLIDRCVVQGFYYGTFESTRVNNSYIGGFRAVFLNYDTKIFATSITNIGVLGLSPNGAGIEIEFTTQLESAYGLYLRYCYPEYNATFRNLRMINVTRQIYYFPNVKDINTKLVDCTVDETNYMFHPSTTRNATTEFISTFIWQLGDGVTVELYDKDSNLILNKIVNNNDTDEVKYAQHYLDASTKTLTLTYQKPFTVVATKEGYKDLVMNVAPITGIRTVVEGTFEVEPPKITGITIAHPNISNSDGAITITAEKGTQPYLYALNGSDYRESNEFAGLGEGVYSVSVKDANNEIDTITGIRLKKTSIYNLQPPLTKIKKQIPTKDLKPVIQPLQTLKTKRL